MSKTVTVGSQTFTLPTQGDDIGYAEEVIAFQEAVSVALGTVQGVNDIPLTTSTISNNLTGNVIGFLHNKNVTRAFKAEYTIKRAMATGTIQSESGTIEGNSNGTDWFIMIESAASSPIGVVLSINNSGQISYTSTDVPGFGIGDIKFKSKSIDV